MTGERLDQMLAAHFRCERAIAAARRFISGNVNATLRRSVRVPVERDHGFQAKLITQSGGR
jgi:hypothetical protein